MLTQDSATQLAITPATGYQPVGSTFSATTGLTPLMTFAWSAQVVTSPSPSIEVTVVYGGGTATDNQQQVQIPWGWTGATTIPSGSNQAIYVSGSVSAVYSTDASAVVTFTGIMVYPNVDRINCTGATVAALMASDS